MSASKGKIAYRYCRVCKKKTRHTRALLGSLFDCSKDHPNDNVCCAKCGILFPKLAIKIAVMLHAKLRYCQRCKTIPFAH